MDVQTQQFVRRAALVLAEAAADLGDLIAAPADARSAAALRGKLTEVRMGAARLQLTELARLATEAETPLERAATARRGLDRLSLQTVGWAVQALDGALASAAAGCAPLAMAA